MRVLLVIAVASLLAPVARAEGRHTLRPGDTLDAVAKHYYGASWKSVYLVAGNGLKDAGEARPGRSIVLPASWIYRIKKGDSLGAVAKKHLGETLRYKGIMLANDISDLQDLEVGREVVMPFHLRHTVQAGESLSGIARAYYRNARMAKLLQEYNDLPQQSVEVGARLIVPIFDRDTLDVRRKPPMPPAEAAKSDEPTPVAAAPPAQAPVAAAVESPPAPSPTAPPPPSPAAPRPNALEGQGPSELKRLVERFRKGGFEEACGGLERLLSDLDLPKSDRVVVIRYLGFCAVASDDRAAARDYFKQWLEMEPKAQLDPVTTSPKILSIFQAVAREVGGASEDGLPPPSSP